MTRVFTLIGILVVAAILADPLWQAIQQIRGTNEAIVLMEGIRQMGKKATTADQKTDAPPIPQAIEVKAECDDYKKQVAATAKDLGGEIELSKIPCPTSL